MRAALIRFWTRHHLLHAPVPLTGTAALQADAPAAAAAWMATFLRAVAGEAAEALDLLVALERAWRAARQAVAGRRRHSRAAAAVDLLAATPLLSASSLAAGLGMAVTNATRLFDQFCAAGITVEVTHRARRRLFGLAGLAPLRDQIAPPRRPEPGRGRGRPRLLPGAEDAATGPPPALPPLAPLERHRVDYNDLDQAMAQLDTVIRQARRALGELAQPRPPDAAHCRATPGTDAGPASNRDPTPFAG